MKKPAILTVDDDREVLGAVERDLRKRYGEKYRVVRADSGKAALDVLNTLKTRNDPVALLLVDQRMPGMTGVDTLKEAIPIFPEAKKALLTAYADTEAAIQAINTTHIDYYLLKPWDPPEQNLYPVLDDLLGDWESCFRPPFEGMRVIGMRFSPESFELKNFLGLNQIPFQWLEIDGNPEARALLERMNIQDPKLPVVVFADGTVFQKPAVNDLAEKLGLHTKPSTPFYDLAIIGAGPAGLAAAVYGASEGLNTILIEAEAAGGQAGTSARIENYLGFPSGISGSDLARRAVTQATRFGVELLTAQRATDVCIKDGYKNVTLSDGSQFSSQALLIATGVQYRKLDAEGVEELAGAGIYYGAANTEAIACKDEEVYIVGGANSAGQGAVFLSQFAKKVNILVRDKDLEKGMSHYLINQIEETENIEVHPQTCVIKASGSERLETLMLKNLETEEEREVDADALFVFIGAVPRTDWLDGFVARDKHGFIPTGPDMMAEEDARKAWPLKREPYLLETNVPGVFVAGDVRAGSVKRVASSVGEGSIVVHMIHRYLSGDNT